MRSLFFCIVAYILLIMMSLSTFANEPKNIASTTLAGGCFWCIETDFEKLDGIVDAVSGYAGGDRPNPTYENYNKPSGDYSVPHIEVIQVTYDTDKLSYRDILEYHMRHIDPTDGEGQFCDRGAGYIPAIFVKNDEQRQIAEQVKAQTATTLGQDVNVKILDDAPFYMAEDYHQDYSHKSPIRYKFYRWNCGRDQRVDELWGSDNAVKSNAELNN